MATEQGYRLVVAGRFRAQSVVGRDDILGQLDTLRSRVGRGEGGGAVVLIGEPGVGKTRVLLEAAARAARDGWTVLEGRASAVAGGASLRPYAEALAGFARHHPDPPAELGAFAPVLGRLVPAWSVPVAPEGAPTLIAEGLLRLSALQPHGLLLALEDLHWADPDSLAVLEYCADHASEVPLLLLATARPDPSAARALLDALDRRGHVEPVPVPRLDPGSVAILAASCLGTERVPDEVADLVGAADGLPLLVEDLLHEAASTGALVHGEGGWQVVAAPATVPASYAALVGTRMAALPEVAARAVEAAAVLGSEVDPRLLALVSGDEEDVVADVLGEVTAAGLLEARSTRAGTTYRFRHALTRDAALARVTGQRRRALASRAADAAAPGLGPGRRAGLLALAGRRDEAARMLLQAARGELLTGTLTAAAELLGRARTLAVDPEVGRAVTVAQVEVLASAGHAAEARAAAATTLPFLPAPEVRALRLRLAATALESQDTDWTRAELDAVRAIGGLGDEEWAEVWSLEAGLALSGSASTRVDEAVRLARRAVGAARRTDRVAAQCRALLLLGRCSRRRDLGAAEDAFRMAFHVADRGFLVMERVHALAELGTVQMMREVRADGLVVAREAAEAVGAPMTAVGIGVNLAAVRIMRGELEAASATARDVELEATRLGMTAAGAAALMMAGLAAGLGGRPEEMEVLLDRAAATGAREPDLLAGSWAIGRSTVALLHEDRDRARHALNQAMRVIRDSPVLMVDPAAGPSVLLDALEGTASEAALDAAEHSSGRGSAWTSMWVDTARAVNAGVAGGDPTAYAEKGLAAAARYPVFGLVAARLLAEAQVRDSWGVPLPLLRDLEQQAAARHYPALARACRALQRAGGAVLPRARAVGAGVPAPLRRLGVTAREADVLELLRDRLSNPEIAARLYLSPRTVEKHVASLLAKTGANRRGELAEIARDPAIAPALAAGRTREPG